jgi:hypothetical protein
MKPFLLNLTIMRTLIDLALQAYLDVHTLIAVINLDKNRLKPPILNEWIENTQVPAVLNISKRKLQYLRDSGNLPYSKCNGKVYYKIRDLYYLIESNYKNNKKK